MILLGDIASPNEYTSTCLKEILLENQNVFSGKRLICNFEGLISDESEPKINQPILYNHSSILSVLHQEQNPVLCLANNHIHDLPGKFEQTLRLFNDENFLYCGAGRNRMEAEEPLIFNEGRQNIALFNKCWNFLLYNYKNPRHGIYVAELKEEKLIERIRQYKKGFPG